MKSVELQLEIKLQLERNKRLYFEKHNGIFVRITP
jgi:hypothetical protein